MSELSVGALESVLVVICNPHILPQALEAVLSGGNKVRMKLPNREPGYQIGDTSLADWLGLSHI